MPQPATLFSARESAPPSGPAYLCGNFRCRYRTFDKLHDCPKCGRVGKFVLASTVAAWNLIAGLVFVMIGLGLMMIGLFFFLGLASGRLTPGEYGWWGTAILPATGAFFLVGGISTIKGYSWFVWLLLLVKR